MCAARRPGCESVAHQSRCQYSVIRGLMHSPVPGHTHTHNNTHDHTHKHSLAPRRKSPSPGERDTAHLHEARSWRATGTFPMTATIQWCPHTAGNNGRPSASPPSRRLRSHSRTAACACLRVLPHSSICQARQPKGCNGVPQGGRAAAGGTHRTRCICTRFSTSPEAT
jgi:hypothetical protein